jgi:M6 family metalloprotease-like protein
LKKLAAQKIALLLLLALGHMTVLGAPFAEKMPFTQPDGAQIVLWGRGDEFYAVFETLDGYTVTFNQQTKAYDYASLTADGEELVSAGVAVGQGNPSALGLKPHVRIKPEAVKKQVAERFARWDQTMEISRRWEDLKRKRRLDEISVAQEAPEPAPPPSTTTGQKLGLTLLIDFSDDVATVAQAEIVDFCNGDNYTGNGNNGSVKQYFLDNSNGLLTYSNVVTIYIRAPKPKSYYNNTAIDCGTQGRLLIGEAINTMKLLTNYATAILPTFSNLTVDGSRRVVAFNVFFAGYNSGVWTKGLYPHAGNMPSPIDLGNGKKVYKYQISSIGTSPALGIFCHENAHMFCGFPDLYDYGLDSTGGAGNFCLMGYGTYASNPVQICAYLKRAAGWATTLPLTSGSHLTASVSSSGADFNKFYCYAKPGVSTEYFLVENRQQSGRDANLPASGIAIWHIDELGDHNNQSTNYNTWHANYEVSLMQADNLWHFQSFGMGDAEDLYYLGNPATGYSNGFSDATSPSARWWDGSSSRVVFHDFSDSGTTMTFSVGPPTFASIAASPSLAKQETAVSITFTASETLASNPTVTVNTHAASYVSNAGTNYTYIYTVQASDADGHATIAISGTDPAGNAGSVTNTTALDVDKTAPTLSCPTTMVVSADAGLCSKSNVTFVVAATDNFAVASTNQVAGLPSGAIFPVGVTTNTFVAADAAGNTNTCTFTVRVVSPPWIESIALANSAVTITWSACANETYRVQYKTNLDDLNWTDLPPDVTASGPVAFRTEEFGAARGFYRVLVVE